MNVLALVTDAFGARGGIAKFNRDLLTAVAADPRVSKVTVVPRGPYDSSEVLPANVEYITPARRGKIGFSLAAGRTAWKMRPDVVLCGHINLLPLASLLASATGASLIALSYGVEVWKDRGFAYRAALRRAKLVISISELTRNRLLEWSKTQFALVSILPPSVDLAQYGIGAKRADLLHRYDLAGRTVLLTTARLTVEDRYKGIDEVLDVLPSLVADKPDLAYLIVGDGDDRQRLVDKAKHLGLAERVVFAGYVPENEKADHFRLADAFVMPGRGEGFGIVYLEALACGVPVIASALDASREAVLHGALGQVVNPDDPAELRAAILTAIGDRERRIPPGLEHFSTSRFNERVAAVLSRVSG